MSKKHERVWKILNYIENFLVLDSAVTACVSILILPFTFLGIPIELKLSTTGLKNCTITAAIKKYKSITKKKKEIDKI